MTSETSQKILHPKRVTKIIATIGPASRSIETLTQLHKSGANMFRINMSHAGIEEGKALIRDIRIVEETVKSRIGILLDLQGPKHRLGTLPDDGLEVMAETEVTFVYNEDKNADAQSVTLHAVPIPHIEIFTSISLGDRLLIDDGKLVCTVTDVGKNTFRAGFENAGKLKSKKGLSLPDTELELNPLTQSDYTNLMGVIDEGVDWVALSFVQRAKDIEHLKSLVGDRANVLAKIEKPQAIKDLTNIIKVSDAIMVARGDLGVEMPLEAVPGLQKHIIRSCRRFGKPVIVATQMLESMIESPTPTRAEVSDVATAVFEGADAIMLSAESAVGKYPREAVQTMDKIARAIQSDRNYRSIIASQRPSAEATDADAISSAVRVMAETLEVAALVCYTETGTTALRIARERPQSPILALTPNIQTARKMALVWGVETFLVDTPETLDLVMELARIVVREKGMGKKGDHILITCGVPLGTPGATNMTRIAEI